jgi:hypothetical protein
VNQGCCLWKTSVTDTRVELVNERPLPSGSVVSLEKCSRIFDNAQPSIACLLSSCSIRRVIT